MQINIAFRRNGKGEDNDKQIKSTEKNRKRLSRFRQKEANPEKLKEDQNRWKTQERQNQTEQRRLKRFLRSTMYNAIFPCICCQRLLFECNVRKVDTALIADVETKKKGLWKTAIDLKDIEKLKVRIDGTAETYICLACKGHLKAGKIPPMSTMNGLKVYEHDKD